MNLEQIERVRRMAREARALAPVDRLRRLPREERARVYASMTRCELAALDHAWAFWARPDLRLAEEPLLGCGQARPANARRWWALMGGRGGGKTAAAARDVVEAAKLGRGVIVHVVGQTIEDACATAINGISGLRAASPEWMGFEFFPSKDKEGPTFRWANGARGRVFGAEVPRKGRGPACNVLWLDDVAAYGPNGRQVIEMLELGFRERMPDGSPARGVISSTWIESEAMDWIREQTGMVYSLCETDDNRTNLDDGLFLDTMKRIEGTELEAVERRGADPEKTRKREFDGVAFAKGHLPERFRVIVVAVDPALSTGQKPCEVGIVAAGSMADGRALVVDDASEMLSALEWPDRVFDVLERWAPMAGEVRIVIETNRSDINPQALLMLCEAARRARAGLPGQSITKIIPVHTAIGKAQRARPLVPLFRSGTIAHVDGLGVVEAQLRELDETVKGGPGRDRADAEVYALLELFGILDRVRPGAMMGGATIAPGTYGGPGLGSINVGQAARSAAPAPGAAVFAFGGAGHFGGGTFT